MPPQSPSPLDKRDQPENENEKLSVIDGQPSEAQTENPPIPPPSPKRPIPFSRSRYAPLLPSRLNPSHATIPIPVVIRPKKSSRFKRYRQEWTPTQQLLRRKAALAYRQATGWKRPPPQRKHVRDKKSPPKAKANATPAPAPSPTPNPASHPNRFFQHRFAGSYTPSSTYDTWVFDDYSKTWVRKGALSYPWIKDRNGDWIPKPTGGWVPSELRGTNNGAVQGIRGNHRFIAHMRFMREARERDAKEREAIRGTRSEVLETSNQDSKEARYTLDVGEGMWVDEMGVPLRGHRQQLGQQQQFAKAEEANVEGEPKHPDSTTMCDGNKAEFPLISNSSNSASSRSSSRSSSFHTVDMARVQSQLLMTTEPGMAVAFPLRRRPDIASVRLTLVMFALLSIVICTVGLAQCLLRSLWRLSDVPA